MSLASPSRRDFLAATAATVALPATCGASVEQPQRVFQAERELYCVVRLPEFRIMRSGLSRGEATAYCQSYNRPGPLSGDGRAVIFRQAPQVRIDGEPIEVEGLPLDIEEEPRPAKPARVADGDPAKHAAAKRLTAFAGGRIEVTFEPGVFFDDEEESAGHLYYGMIELDNSGVLTLDDRLATPLEAQIVAELRDFAKSFNDLAAELAQRISV